MRSLTPPGLVPVDGAVVAVLGSSLAFLCICKHALTLPEDRGCWQALHKDATQAVGCPCGGQR